MSMDERGDVYSRSPSAGSPAGWYPMYSGERLRARAFGGGPAPVMAWWTGEAWDESETTVLFSSRIGSHARRGSMVMAVPWIFLFAALAATLMAVDESTSDWAFPATFAVYLSLVWVLWFRRGPANVELTSGYLTFAYDQKPEGVWTIPVSNILAVRVSRNLPAWCERSRIEVVLVDGGRLSARGVAGADALIDVLIERGVIARDRVAG